jgi:hypothetical protein
MVHDQQKLQEFLIKRNKVHFNQAHGTPFTVEPLDKLDWSACSNESESLLKGQIPQEIQSPNKYAMKILKHIAEKPQLPEIDTYLSPEDVAQGFRRWKESTSTSPSGCHLGLRRIPAIPTMDEETEKIRTGILVIQTHIINIPLTHGFSPDRWQTVINAMLEKVPGNPLLHKLRVIHLLEADYNLTLKAIFGRRLLYNCESHGALGDLQDGFRKGRSTTRTLLHNEIINDYNKRLRIDNYTGMTDISGCFDRILPSMIALLNRKNGCTREAVQMHSTTLQRAKYYIKTQHGISSEFYSNEELPIYGNGQGAGDSPSQWCQQSALLFDIYKDENTGAQMSNKNGNTRVSIPMAAFADDTNLLGNNDNNEKTPEELTEEAKNAFATWNGLLNAAGHFMELTKCACYLSFWKFQEDGYAYTMQPEEHGQKIFVTDINGQEKEIPQLESNKSQKLLGVMKCPIGDQQDEISRLKQKSNMYAKRMNANHLNRTDARLAYKVFYIPAMRYSLQITSINQVDMETVQSKATVAFLSAQGFNRNMPREVAFAPTIYQGLGLRHLYDLQGSDGTRLLLQELNTEKSMTQTMILTLLEAMQLEAGIGDPILENCSPLAYIEWGWIPHIRDFLHHINGKILGATPRPKLYRENDSYLMDAHHLLDFSRREIIYIHRCRLHLQVETMSDISTASGTSILKAWYTKSDKKPSRSKLRWPRQDAPCNAAWATWRKFLQKFTTPAGKLRKELGRWTQPNNSRIFQAYTTPTDQLIMHDESGLWWSFELEKKHRKSRTFLVWTKTKSSEPSTTHIPTDVLHISETRITVANPTNKLPEEIEGQEPNKWYELATANTCHLIGKINLTMPEEDIEKLIKRGSNLEFASDGGHDPVSGISTFGWVAAINRTIIAQGRGPAQSHPLLAESFRAEGYGIASTALFARNLINKFQINAEEHKWTFYLDNKSMIQRLVGYSQFMTPKMNLRPDEDITKIAFLILNSIPHELVHVKSHQDAKKELHELPFPAIINIMADQQATRQRNLMTEPDKEVNNLATAQLQIADICITRDSQKWLLHSAGKIPIQNYYREKFGWNISTFNNIAWDAQKSALQSFALADQTRILKFVHGWLPTASRTFKEGSSVSQRCAICYAPREDNLHLFQCTNRVMDTIQEKLQFFLVKDMHDHGDSELNNIIEIGILNAGMTPKWAPSIADVSRKWRTAVRDQTSIGWDQLLRGRISKTIIKMVDQHYEAQELSTIMYNGRRWAKKLITVIWTTMLELWSTRNSIIYNSNQDLAERQMKEKLETRVRRCYDHKTLLKAHEQTQWFSLPLEARLTEDAKHTINWLQGAERLIKITRRELKKRPRESIILERFLKVKNNTQEQGNREAEEPRAYVQELNPD